MASEWMPVQLSLFLHPDQLQNTLSGMQGQGATAVPTIKSLPSRICAKQQNTNETPQ